ncbi:helix-turn-helix domain-containing protein [Robertmurraya kyonggiensis]|uniref:Helix-turn-helix transcriptional regulator n=1 Tax=Robertmurraya kyonggiensis TaxID=1037680 RepID=A0A4U1D3H4_9BACI|nr:helix-turn-helix transcriptional regulator [Robertmurraya kyonggiensis]TKC15666.1 helix-turn-helix transcriptional regulator [Robertmurraya kyonggiensis]
MKDIGQVIKEQRLKRDIPQNELADRLGVAPSFLSKIENGQKTISITRLLEIGEILGINFFEHSDQDDDLYMKWKEVIRVFEEKGVTPDQMLNFIKAIEKLGK